MTSNTNCTVSDAPKEGTAGRVYLVATGEVHEGQATYTRHDVLPPLCDAETLYSTPTALVEGVRSAEQGHAALAQPKVEVVNCEEEHPNSRLLFKRMCQKFGIVLGVDRVDVALSKIAGAAVQPPALGDAFNDAVSWCESNGIQLEPEQLSSLVNYITHGKALVPLKMTRAMERVTQEDEWEWADLLEAAGVTEEQYEAALSMDLTALESTLQAQEKAKTYCPQREQIMKVCDILQRIKEAHEHWGGWSGTPSHCDNAINLLRYPADAPVNADPTPQN